MYCGGWLVITRSSSEGGAFKLRHKDGEEGGLVGSKLGQSTQGKGGNTCKGPVAGRRKCMPRAWRADSRGEG